MITILQEKDLTARGRGIERSKLNADCFRIGLDAFRHSDLVIYVDNISTLVLKDRFQEMRPSPPSQLGDLINAYLAAENKT